MFMTIVIILQSYNKGSDWLLQLQYLQNKWDTSIFHIFEATHLDEYSRTSVTWRYFEALYEKYVFYT